ncbi:glycosyltransferase domain-containing protein [Microvirga sp. RSM25]|uniref:glycosyltransferase domain-containing protein n=1 Tax=Microvirga sp. RSM25 TaxID=3273802 RepID=UPI00384BA608
MRSAPSNMLKHPLRVLARRAPGLANSVRRMLDVTKDTLWAVLPKRAVAVLADNHWELRPDIEKAVEDYRKVEHAVDRKIVVYTAIFGKYDNLLLPDVIDPGIDYVCFTDRPRDDYGVWQMRSAAYYHPDATRIARWVKTHPHDLFPDHEVAVWLDANIILKGDVRQYIEQIGRERSDLGLVSHPHRGCFYEEAEACKRLKKDSTAAIDSQIEHYRQSGLPESQPVFETGFMIVDLRSSKTAAALHLWWQQIEQFSRRDQLGLAWVTYKLPNLKIAPLLPPGYSVRDHADFRYFRHIHARTLIIPNKLLRLGAKVSPADGTPFSDVKDRRLQLLMDVPIDIIICVHNALEDVRLCLESVRTSLLAEHRIIIVNDRSDEQTSAYLRQFADDESQATLIENTQNLGYTGSANRGLAAGTAEFRILLNSDTIVCPNWALKLLEAANRSDQIGIVGPLSNAAGAQSIPHVRNIGNNTAINALPRGMNLVDLDLACERWSHADLLPRVPLVHGFCLGVKKDVIERIGLFDDENFKRFYGEENDYCFRALKAGFELAIATNTFVFHRKSRSIEEEKRVVHMAEAWKRLREIYGADRILGAYRQVEEHPFLEVIRREATVYFKGAHGGTSSYLKTTRS